MLLELAIFFTPILVDLRTNEHFEFVKLFFVYGMAATLAYVFILRKLLHTKPEKITRPHLLVVLFVALVVLSTIVSSHPYTSVWGYYTRFNGGLLSLVAFCILYCVTINTPPSQVLRALYAAAATLVPIGLVGGYQYLLTPDKRVYSTLGQPNWLAAYSVMVLPIVGYLLLTAKSKMVRAGLAGIILAAYATLWLTYSLAGMVGFAAAGVVFVALNRKLLKAHWREAVTLGMLCLTISVATPGIYTEKLRDIFIDVQKVYAQENTAGALTNFVSDPGYIRLLLWQGTLNLAASSPKNFLLGTGPETFTYAFQAFRPSELNYSSEWAYILNKPHNYYLEILAESGLPALVVYLGIIYWSLKHKHPFLTAGLVGYYVTNLFGFPVVATELLFWIYLGALQVARQDTLQ